MSCCFLEVELVGKAAEEVEERLCHSYAFNGHRDRVSCCTYAIPGNDEEHVESAEGCEVMEAEDAGSNEVVVEVRGSYHDGWWSCAQQRGLESTVVQKGWMVESI